MARFYAFESLFKKKEDYEKSDLKKLIINNYNTRIEELED